MRADIYRTLQPNVFLLLPEGASVNTVPIGVISTVGRPTHLNTRELDESRLCVDRVAISEELNKQGFCLWRTGMTNDQ